MNKFERARPAGWYEPPDEPMECRSCDGGKVVQVDSWTDAQGTPHRFMHSGSSRPWEMPCPHCDGTGNEPETQQDPDRQRDEKLDKEEGG